MKDYYAILGAPREAEDDLIKATYLALSKIYHPDIYKGDKKYALKRMQEINEAYEILKDPKKRKAYDEKNKDTADESSFDESEFQDEQDSYQDIIKEAWDFAKDYYPDIETEYNNLKKINKNLAWQFQILCVETKSFYNADISSKRLQKDWLEKRFGKTIKLQKLALKAILRNEIKVAREINKVFKVLGDKDVDTIIRGLKNKFPYFFVTNDPKPKYEYGPKAKNENGLFFYKGYGYRNIDDIGESYWRIVDSPYDTYIETEFSSEEKLKDYVDEEVNKNKYY